MNMAERLLMDAQLPNSEGKMEIPAK